MKKDEKKLTDQLTEIQEISKSIDLYKSINVDSGYIKTSWKIKHHLRKQLVRNMFNRAAAILVLPLLISTLVLLYIIITDKEPASALFTEIKAAPGIIIQTELPDRSIVWLNSGSTLRYPVQFHGDKRAVELVGEAFFNVQSNPDYPFEVTIPSGLNIIACGTEFNVNAYKEDLVNEVVLQEGAIDVSYNRKIYSMRPNEMLSFNNEKHSIIKSKVNIEEKTAWKNGFLIFRNTPLEEVIKRLSRHYNVDITLHNEKNTDYRIRASFSDETIIQIFDFLKMAVPLEWSIIEVEQNRDATFTRQQIVVNLK